MKKIILLIIMIIIMSGFATADQGTFKKEQCVNIIQTCSSCTFINITGIFDPSTSANLINNTGMEKQGDIYNHTFCETNNVGMYKIAFTGDVDGVNTPVTDSFYITSEGNSYPIYILLLVITIVMLLTYTLLIFGTMKEDVAMVAIASLIMTIIGVYIHVNGLGDIKNLVTDAFALINWAIGGYIFIRVLMEDAMESLGG
jgi:hypothetical protein